MRDAESYARERKNLDDVLGALNAEGDFAADRYPAVLMILAMQAQPITTQEDTVYIRGRPVQARRAASPPSFSDEEYQSAHGLLVSTLRAYVDSWNQAHQNIRRWVKANPELALRFNRDARADRAEVQGVQVQGVSVALPSAPARLNPRLRARRFAARLFLELLNGRFASSIARCQRCGRYFARLTRHKKTYCTRRCALAASARRGMARQRAQLRAARIGLARKAIARWKRRRPRQDWKTWLLRRHGKNGITRHWLTRAVNRGWLKPPGRKGEKNQ